ncbi:MAG: peptidoglycan DD-metalloendopeptidase family protein [Candidatus Paceibacterota bacterium]
MKHYHDYKREFSFILVGFLLIIPTVFSYAQNATELRNQINSYSSKINNLEDTNKKIQEQLNVLSNQSNSLSKTIKELDLIKKKLNSDISITQNKIERKNLEIKELSSQIGNKEVSIIQNKEAIFLGIKQISEMEEESMIEKFLINEKISDAWIDIDNIITLRDRLRGNVVNLGVVKGQLENTREDTTSAKIELMSLKTELSDQKKIVDQNVNEKKKILSQTKNNETNYQNLLKSNLAKMQALQKELSDYESQLKYILDPKKLPGKGVLSWPLDYIYITSYFGARVVNGVAGFHSGIDLRARTPVPVKAMADGVIGGTGDTDVQCPGASFGRFILIKYNNGLASTYGHLSLIKVKKGDSVVRGQIVGYTGNTGYSTGPHLHLSVYPRDAVNVQNLPSKSCPGHNLTQPIAATNAYLNPMSYLPSL